MARSPTGEQSPGTHRSRPPSLTSACAITTCGQGSRRRRCGGCGRPGALGASFSRPRVPRPGSPARGARLRPPTAGRGAHLEPLGPRVAEASRAPARRLPRLGSLVPAAPPVAACSLQPRGACRSRRQRITRERPGRERGREAARRAGAARKAEHRAALLCQPSLPGQVWPGPVWPGPVRGLRYPGSRGASGRKETCLPPPSCAPALGSPHCDPPRATARDLAYSHAHPPQRDCSGRKAGVRLLLPPPQLCLCPGAPPPSYGIPGGSIPSQGLSSSPNLTFIA